MYLEFHNILLCPPKKKKNHVGNEVGQHADMEHLEFRKDIPDAT